MAVTIRPLEAGDLDDVVDVALRAWEPVFASIGKVVGPSLFRAFYGDDWRAYQAADVRRACTELDASVAELDGRVVGYTAVDLSDAESGEIYMVAVDPDAQGHGVGGALSRDAVERIRAAGKPLATVSTGGDPGHASARATYEAAGFTPWPGVQYFLEL